MVGAGLDLARHRQGGQEKQAFGRKGLGQGWWDLDLFSPSSETPPFS